MLVCVYRLDLCVCLCGWNGPSLFKYLGPYLEFIVDCLFVYIGKTSLYVYVAGLDPLPSSI